MIKGIGMKGKKMDGGICIFVNKHWHLGCCSADRQQAKPTAARILQK